MQIVVQYGAIPYVSLTRRSPFSVERIGAQYVDIDTGTIRYPTYRYMVYGITTAHWIYVLLRTRG
jgi:hypothetical protein